MDTINKSINNSGSIIRLSWLCDCLCCRDLCLVERWLNGIEGLWNCGLDQIVQSLLNLAVNIRRALSTKESLDYRYNSWTNCSAFTIWSSCVSKSIKTVRKSRINEISSVWSLDVLSDSGSKIRAIECLLSCLLSHT